MVLVRQEQLHELLREPSSANIELRVRVVHDGLETGALLPTDGPNIGRFDSSR